MDLPNENQLNARINNLTIYTICLKCKNSILRDTEVCLKNCQHSFCRSCLEDIILTTHDKIYATVKCPEGNCNKNITRAEIKTILGELYIFFMMQIKINREEDDNLIVIPNQEPFECPVCYAEIEINDGVELQNCAHFFSRDCIVNQVIHSETCEVKCLEPECGELILECEIRSLLPEKDFNNYLKKGIDVAEHSNVLTVHCITKDCSYFVESDGNVENFKCETCKKVNCLKCKAIHEGKTCDEYKEELKNNAIKQQQMIEIEQNENAIEEDINNGLAMRCPRCTIAVMKIEGCDFLTCTACQLNLCWCTKKSRKPFTNTDGTIIEGCKCKEPPTGALCHPNCKNCH